MSNSYSWPLSKISDPQANDILIGNDESNGFSSSHHSGSGQQRFLRMIQDHYEEYERKGRMEKPLVAMDILKRWRSQEPTGRFLVTEDETRPPLYKDVGDKRARSYISKALRMASKCANNEEKSSLGDIFELLSREDKNNNDVVVDNIWQDPTKGGIFEREHHIQQLLAAYNRRRRSKPEDAPEIVLLSGPSGCGKTCLATSIQEYVEQDGGFFVTRKYDQRHRNASPYAPLSTAFGKLAERISSRKDETGQAIKQSIYDALGTEVHTLIEFIPTLGEFMGVAGIDTNLPSSEEDEFRLDGKERRLRFLSLWRRLLGAVCNPDRPICLLLDDLQWADDTWLELIQTVFNPSLENIPGLVVFGSVRGNEVSVHDNLSNTLRTLEDGGTNITLIEVGNLSVEGLSNMISNYLELDMQHCLPLAEIVHAQTEGNALFARQYLIQLNKDGVIYRDSSSGRWTWKVEQAILSLEESGHADMTVRLLASKIKQLPPYVAKVLQAASSFGADFEEEMLCHSGVTVSSQVLLALELADEQGIIFYDVDTGACRFAHDKFQEAAYSLLPEKDRAQFHVSIGRNLRKQLSSTDVKEHIFLVVDQMRLGVSLIQNEEEKDDLSRLSLHAARQAAQVSAFSAAVGYVNFGIQQLGIRNWRDQYDLSLDLYSTSIELAYCTGSLDSINDLANIVAANARSFGDKQRAFMTQVVAYGSRGDPERAKQLCFEMLRKLGEPFPQRASTLRTMFEYYRIKRMLRCRKEEDILNLDKLQDPGALAKMQIIMLLYPQLMLTNHQSAPLAGFWLIRLTLQHGICSISSIGFLIYGMILVRRGEVDDGHRFGHLALQILEKFPSRQLEARVKFFFWAFIETPIEHLRTVLDSQIAVHSLALRNGDIEVGMLSGIFPILFRLSLGDPLDKLLSEVKRLEKLCLGYGQLKGLAFGAAVGQVCCNLLGLSKDPLILSGEFMEEGESRILREMQQNSQEAVVTIVLHFQYFLATYLNEYEFAYALYRKNRRRWASAVIISLFQTSQVFFQGLNFAGYARKCFGRERRRNLSRAQKCITAFQKLLTHCPENFINKLYLIKAEVLFTEGQHCAALWNYKKAIAYADREGFISEQALACEKTGLMLVSAGRKSDAKVYFEEARTLYKSWGAIVKVEHVEKLISDTISEGDGHAMNVKEMSPK